MEIQKHMMVVSYKDLVHKVLLVLVYIHCSSSALLKREYTMKMVGVNQSVAVSGCQPGHLLNLRPDFRNSVVNQLRPYYNSGNLVNGHLYWLGLSRASSSNQFSWYDGKIQVDMNMGDIPHILYGTARDNENCVALKWSVEKQGFIITIEACVSTWFPFCELETGKPCDYTRLGNVYITPDGGYQVRDISGVDTRALCEGKCTDWSEINSDECWMFTYNAGSRSCLLVTENVMPHWEETCSWLSADDVWEAWSRNCLDVHVLDERGKNIILGPCALLKQETTSTTSLLSTSPPEMASTELLMSSDDTLYASTSSSEVVDKTASSVFSNDVVDEGLTSTFPNEVFTLSVEKISTASSFVQESLFSSSTNHINGKTTVGFSTNLYDFNHHHTTVGFSTNLYDFNHHTESKGQTEFRIYTTSTTLLDSVSLISTGIQVTPVQTSVTETVHIGFTSSTAQDTVSPASDMSISMATEDDCFKFCPCNQTLLRKAKSTFINEILISLNLDKKNTSAYRRQYNSALDERPLSVGLGWSGVFLLVFVFGGILVLDSKRLFTDTMMLFSNIKSLLKQKK